MRLGWHVKEILRLGDFVPVINQKCMYGMTPIPMHDVISTTENCAVLRGRMCDCHSETVYCLNTFVRFHHFGMTTSTFCLAPKLAKYLGTVVI